jgi:hypothetical protein
MMFNFKAAAAAVVAGALLATAPAAMAKGGDGGGGGSCGTIDNFTQTVDAADVVSWSVTTTNLCLDEFAGSTSFDFTSNGVFAGREVYMGLGTRTWSRSFVGTPGVRYTMTVSINRPNGKLAASQTKSVTAP